MNNENELVDPVWVAIEVSDITAAVDLYVNQWQLFSIVNSLPGKGGFASLEFLDAKTRFRLQVRDGPKVDTKGRSILAAKNLYIRLQKTDFYVWVDSVLGNRDGLEQTPWSTYVVLNDPFGHMFVIASYCSFRKLA